MSAALHVRNLGREKDRCQVYLLHSGTKETEAPWVQCLAFLKGPSFLSGSELIEKLKLKAGEIDSLPQGHENLIWMTSTHINLGGGVCW